MTAEIIRFPGNPPPEGYSQEYIDKLHSEAFRDLEDSISECATMANIALQLAEKAIESRDDKADKAMLGRRSCCEDECSHAEAELCTSLAQGEQEQAMRLIRAVIMLWRLQACALAPADGAPLVPLKTIRLG